MTTGDKPAQPGARILLASSDSATVAAAQPVLAAAGYEVVVVDRGPDVLHYTGEQRVDLYLLDHDLPLMPGLRVARHLRQSYGVARDRLVLIYPAGLLPNYQAEIQATEVLAAPFTGVELILCVMRHLGQAA